MEHILRYLGDIGCRELWVSKHTGLGYSDWAHKTVNLNHHGDAVMGIEAPLSERDELTTTEAVEAISQAAIAMGVSEDVVLSALTDPNIGQFSFHLE